MDDEGGYVGRWMEGALLVGLMVFAAACEGEDALGPGEYPVFEIEQAGEIFHLAVADETVAATLEALRQSGEAAGVISGALLPGDGGFNAPYSWHVDPETVEVVDVAMELCDGRPSFVEEELEYWLGTVKRYCPWGPKVVGRK